MKKHSAPLSSLLPMTAPRVPLCLEINPPRGCDAQAIFEKLDAQDLSCVDLFNVTDCALAKLKMHAPTFATVLSRRYNKNVVVNLSCRDRNLLGLESELLGIHFSGLLGVVAITGDAMSVGDNPERKGVFEVNSVKLMECLSRCNAGGDADGRPLKGATDLLVCGVANPHSTNQVAELKRLKKKKDAGARVILTQPVFDASTTKDFFAHATQELGLDMFAGLLAFKTPKAALHGQSVPGVKVPLDRYMHLSPEQDISEQSIEECLETASALRGVVTGFHVITGGNMTIALRLIKRLSEVL